MSDPLVTCLCLTRNRREWVPKSIACFMAQTYPNRELLIVADTRADWEGLIPDDPRITVGEAAGKVGAKRNAGCEIARGELIAHWDDDDHSEPGRLAGQVARLQATGKSVTGYHSMKFTDGARWWFYKSAIPTGNALGTSLCYSKAWWAKHRFEEIQCGQDEAFVAWAVRERQLASEADLTLMYATVHPGHTSPRGLPRPTPSLTWIPLKDYQWPN